MRIKYLFATLVSALLLAVNAKAQDKIVLRNGGVIEAKVIEVAPRTITYKKSNNPDGPDFIISSREVERIQYANGTKDEISDVREREYDHDRGRRSRHWGASNEKYGKNIIAIAPIQMANEGPAGVGIHYERVIDKKNIISLKLPFAVIFQSEDRYNSGTNLSEREITPFYYFYPGVKIYPTGSNRRISYGVGPSVPLGFGRKLTSRYVGGNTVYSEKDVFKTGLLINNSLNMQPSKNLYIGMELGLGFGYYDSGDNLATFDSSDPFVQFNFAIGYRF